MELSYTKKVPLSRARYKCECPEKCSHAVEFLDPLDQGRVLTLCSGKATAYAYDILKTTGILKTAPAGGRMKVDGRTLNRNWTTLEEKALVTYVVENGIVYGGYRIFAEQHGKTVRAVKEKVRKLRKEGRVPPGRKQ